MAKKQSGRLNLLFDDFDTEEKMLERQQNAQKRRRVALTLLAEERMIMDDLIFRYPNLVMPSKVKLEISRLVSARINLGTYPTQESVHGHILQVEALFVYSILKSVIRCQSNDAVVAELIEKSGLGSIRLPRVDLDGTMFKKYERPLHSEKQREDFLKSLTSIKDHTVLGN